ncbi:WD40/YVTN/BNR-like repeat-containing protein [Halarchaeum sp. P4]|uniref:WD40/YVTN/BNR-like repeat-containing protein n=1 Tax=Halarchaeum sp. P4 TaxID=3421639 RepID=UPI003EBA21BC
MWQLGPEANEPEWRQVDTPFTNDLFEICQTTVGPYAVGDGGVLAGNRNNEGWEIILDDGPNARDNQLRGMDVTDDGKRLWFLGSSGAIGCYDVETRRKYDYSYPKEMTSTWEGITVAGPAGKEKGLAANGSGEVLPFTIDGFDVDWGVATKPVSGKASKIAALASTEEGVGFCIDTSGNAFKTTKEEGWKDIGIVNAQVKFYDIYAGSHGKVYVSAGDGRLYRYDDSYRSWTPISVGSASLRAFDMYDTQMCVLGDNGIFYERQFGGERWEKVHTPVSATLYDVKLGKPDVAVGKSGTVIKRLRGKTKQSGKSADGDNYEGRGEIYDNDNNQRGEKANDDSGETSGDSTSGDSTSGDSTSGDSTSGGSTNDETTSQ